MSYLVVFVLVVTSMISGMPVGVQAANFTQLTVTTGTDTSATTGSNAFAVTIGGGIANTDPKYDTIAEIKAELQSAIEAGCGGYYNFEVAPEETSISGDTSTNLDIKYGSSAGHNDKKLKISASAANYFGKGSAGSNRTPSSGTQGKNGGTSDFTLNIGSITNGQINEKVIAIGFAILNRATYADTVNVTYNYAEVGTPGTLSTTLQNVAAGADNTYFFFSAPEGKTISSIVVDFVGGTFGGLDDISFITNAANKTALNTAITVAQAIYIAAVEGLASGQYPVGSKAILWNSISVAVAANSNPNAPQLTINTAAIDLNASITAFQAKIISSVVKTALANAINFAKAIYNSSVVGYGDGQYTAANKSTFASAISVVDTVYCNPGVSQVMVDQAVITINTATQTFQASALKVDNTSLKALINTAQAVCNIAVIGTNEGQYPMWAKDALNYSISISQSVYSSPNITKATIIEASGDLNQALIMFNRSVLKDRANLKDAMDSVQSVINKAVVGSKQGQYPQAAKDALSAALAIAVGVYNDASKAQSEYKIAATTLYAAKATFLQTVIRIMGNSVDFLQLVRAFADEMIAYGRDDSRYGSKTSPLFSTALRRDTGHAEMLPYPLFETYKSPDFENDPWGLYPAVDQKDGSKFEGHRQGDRWNYWPSPDHQYYNIPTYSEDSHKQMVSGADPFDELGLYKALFKLTELTGDTKYKDAADQDLSWFYANTQGASGIFPWGEHQGWDFRYDYLRYQVPGYEDFWENPYFGQDRTTEVYEGFQEEQRIYTTIPKFFIQPLINTPLKSGEIYTPLEKYALGEWEQHFFDKDFGKYNRHGDYFGMYRGIKEGYANYKGIDKSLVPSEYGDVGNYPKYAGWYFEIFSYAYKNSTNAAFKAKMVEYLHKLTLNNYINASDNSSFAKSMGAQILQAAYQAQIIAERMKADEPALSAELQAYADKWIADFKSWNGEHYTGDISRVLDAYMYTKRPDLLQWARDCADAAMNPSLSTRPDSYGSAMENLIKAYQLFGDSKYIVKAAQIARDGAAMFIDSLSPLPKGVAGETMKSDDGVLWTPYYHAFLGGDDLMNGMIQVYAELQKAGNINNLPPLADAGANQNVAPGSIVILDGSKSMDYENGKLSYQWSAPEGITLVGADGPNPLFTAPVVSVNTPYIFTLIVNDGTRNSSASTVKITVEGGKRILPLKDTYVQYSGTPQYNGSGEMFIASAATVNNVLISPYAFGILKYDLSGFTTITDAELILTPVYKVGDKTISIHAYTDNNWDEMAAKWDNVNTMLGTELASNTITPSDIYINKSFKSQDLTNYLRNSLNTDKFASLTVSGTNADPWTRFATRENSNANYRPYLIVSGTSANKNPVVNAGTCFIAERRQIVTLNGTATDAEGKSMTYSWSAPAGITLSNRTALTTNFTIPSDAPIGTQYTFTLVARDADGGSGYGQVTVTVVQDGVPTSITITGSQLINKPASGSVTYNYQAVVMNQYNNKMSDQVVTWALTNAPAGVQVDTSTGSLIVQSTVDIYSIITLNASVGDGTIKKSIDIQFKYPVLSPIGNQTVKEGETLSFAVNATNPTSDVLVYNAENLPAGAVFQADASGRYTFTWTPSYLQAGLYADVKIIVSIPVCTIAETITIIVNNQQSGNIDAATKSEVKRSLTFSTHFNAQVNHLLGQAIYCIDMKKTREAIQSNLNASKDNFKTQQQYMDQLEKNLYEQPEKMTAEEYSEMKVKLGEVKALLAQAEIELTSALSSFESNKPLADVKISADQARAYNRAVNDLLTEMEKIK